MIERYRLVSNCIDYPTVSRFAKDYFKCIEDYKKAQTKNCVRLH